MLKNILKAIFVLIGATLGWLLGRLLLNLEFIRPIGIDQNPIAQYAVIGILALIFAFIFFMFSPIFIRYVIRMVEAVDKNFQKMALPDVFLGAVGGLVALAIAYFVLSRPLYEIQVIGSVLALLVNVIAFVLGATIAMKKKDEFGQLLSGIRTGKVHTGKGASNKKTEFEGEPKVLDTSVIIDGRIFDICQTGFVEGTLVIPNFVLEELRHIADSSDSLKRNRGRRGLDILNRIQKELDIEVRIWDREVKDAREVDIKLLKLAKEIGGKVVTNDYNLNKVAEFQGVPVLNINELANAVKPVLLPGEELSILVAKIGKEQNQGIGYLDDGTMIVIENGKRYVNSTIDVVVTSVLQTAAGRMIFARPKDQ